MKVKVICNNNDCKSEFYVYPSVIKSGGGKFCNKECFYKSKAVEKVKIICKTCNKDFYVYPSIAKDGVTCCSDECRDEYYKKIEVKCKNCKKVMFLTKNSKVKFCDRDCYRIFVGNIKNIKTLCKYCKKEYLISEADFNMAANKFCSSECINSFLNSIELKLICRNCKNEFISHNLFTNSLDHFCSYNCRETFIEIEKVKVLCINCKEEHLVIVNDFYIKDRNISVYCNKENLKDRIKTTVIERKIIKCKNCNEEFLVPLFCDIIFCSFLCYSTFKHENDKTNVLVEMICKTCNAPFFAKWHDVNIGKAKYCSPECYNKKRGIRGDFYIHGGYKYIYKPEHPNANLGYVYEHRLVMEEFIGRYLKTEEFVHHKDFNKLNNNISNLEIMSNSSHMFLHAKEYFGRIKNKKNEEILYFD